MYDYIPAVIEKDGRGRQRAYDLFSRLMKDRIIFIGTPINDLIANAVTGQLLFLTLQSKKPIHIYMNTPGGSITAGMAIYDTMQYINNEVNTYCIGQCASMGAVLLAAGTKGHRFILPHAQVMIHQPWGGTQGSASDIEIQAENIIKWKSILNGILADHTGQELERVKDDTDRDNYMSAEEAVEYGLVDEILVKQAKTSHLSPEDAEEEDDHIDGEGD